MNWRIVRSRDRDGELTSRVLHFPPSDQFVGQTRVETGTRWRSGQFSPAAALGRAELRLDLPRRRRLLSKIGWVYCGRSLGAVVPVLPESNWCLVWVGVGGGWAAGVAPPRLPDDFDAAPLGVLEGFSRALFGVRDDELGC